MKVRYLRGLALVGVMAFVVSGASALASTKAPAKNLTFKNGPDSQFNIGGGTRFDGWYDKTAKRVYFLGMRNGDDSTSGEVWYYDAAAKSYVDTGTAMPTPVSNYGIAALKNKNGVLGLYIFGGRDANASIVTDVQVYDPAANTATKLANADAFPGKTPLGCVPLPAMGVAQLGNKAYVMGGSSFSSAGCQDDNSAQTWIFDPTKGKGAKWSKGPKLNMARGYITPAVLGGKIYAIGGDENQAGTLVAQSIVESWNGDPASTWKDGAVTDLPEPCDESQAFGFDTGPLKNTITLVGCGQWPNDLPDVLQYDSTSDSWSTVGALNESRRNHAGANIGSNKKPKLYVVGGYGADGATVETTSEIGTPSPNGTWVFRPSAPSHASTGRASVA
jgi:N-acetylneuraminic acid mutarotase